MSNRENKTESLEILVNAARSKVDYQLNADNALDSKIGILLGFSATVAVFYIGIIDKVFILVALVPLVLLVISSGLLVQALRIKDYYTGVIDVSDESQDFKEYAEYSKYKLLDKLRLDYQSAYDLNEKSNKDKEMLYRSASIYFGVAILLIIIFYIFSLCITTNQPRKINLNQNQHNQTFHQRLEILVSPYQKETRKNDPDKKT